MSLAEIEALPVPSLADPSGCHLYLWVTNNYLFAGGRIMEAWGFRYVTIITWAKTRAGLGQYFRGMTEHVLFAVRGSLPYATTPEGGRCQGTTLIQAPAGEHSVKPDEFRAVIERVSIGPRIELFARRGYPGWDAFGNQVEPSLWNQKRGSEGAPTSMLTPSHG